MASIKKLAAQLDTLAKQLQACTRCGMCQAVCPLFAETGREADLSRGKLALLQGLTRGLFDRPDGVMERLNRCLLCGSCQSQCSSGVDVLSIFLQARVILAEFKGLSFSEKLILRRLLAKPEALNTVSDLLARYQRLFSQTASPELGTSCTRVPLPILGNRHFVPLAPKPFHRLRPQTEIPTGKSGLRVGFFIGCLIDKLFPTVAEAAMLTLDHHEVGVSLPSNQGCCGIPALSAGDIQTFDKLVRHTLTLFNPDSIDYLVTACATCTYTLQKVWPLMQERLPADRQKQVIALAEKTMDINRLLVDVIGIDKPPTPVAGDVPRKITYHDPCHLKKSLGISAQPRQLIQANPDWELVEMAEADRCCGMGGSFNLHHYDLSAAIGYRKAGHIQDTGSAVVATGCPACMAQLSDALSRCGSRIGVRHSIEIYAESLTN